MAIATAGRTTIERVLASGSMNEALSNPAAWVQFGTAAKGMMSLVALSTLRVYAMLYMFPPTNDQIIQGPVRNGLCLTIGCYIAWGQPLHVVDGVSNPMLAAMMLKEALLGVVLGFLASIVFWVAEGVGALVDNQAGFNSVQQNNPLSGEQSTPVSNLMSQLSISVFWMLGGATALVGTLFKSFQWWPLSKLTLEWSNVIELFSGTYLMRYMQQTVTIAAPLLLVLVLIDLGFGVVNKTADKLEPSSISQPVKAAVATILLAMLIPIFFEEAKPALALKHLERDMEFWVSGAKAAR